MIPDCRPLASLPLSDQQRRIARMLNCHPDPVHWPRRIVNRLCRIEDKSGKEALSRAVYDLLQASKYTPLCDCESLLDAGPWLM